jgi:hypothetical protein
MTASPDRCLAGGNVDLELLIKTPEHLSVAVFQLAFSLARNVIGGGGTRLR